MISKKCNFKFILSLICLCLLTGVLALTYSIAQGTAQENLALVFIVDDSGSMTGYDPENLRYTAVKLMISSLDAGDKVGFIRFSNSSELVTDGFVTLTSEETKLSLINAIELPIPDGYTDFLAALRDAQFILDNAEDLSNHKTIIVFLTDGYPFPAVSYPRYLDDVISLSRDLSVPIYAIALTPEGQSATLNQMAQVSGGRLIFANTADDLLDSYLQVLGELKDRTVIKGDVSESGSQTIFLNPALMPYVSKVSFIAAHPKDGQVSLTSPSGVQITETNPAVDFIMQDDPAFTVISLDLIQGGIWEMTYSGSRPPQVRAILNSRLRVNILEPENIFQAGRPITFVVNLVEEMQDGSIRRIVGEANFSAEIELPDGNLQSLDRFYDDGTFGDEVAGDGNFSRQFVDTSKSGTYKVTIIGSKDIIPVTTFRSFTAIEIPELTISDPRFENYEIGDEAIQVVLSFDNEEFIEDSFEGKISLRIIDPDRDFEIIDLTQDGNLFRGEFFPAIGGEYLLRAELSEAFYLGVQMADHIEKSITVRLIPSLVVRDHYVGLDAPFVPAQFTNEEAAQGIPFTVTVFSTSTQQETITITAEGLSGFSVLQTDPVIIEPLSENKISITLIPDSRLFTGDWSGLLSIRPFSAVNVSREQLSIAFSIVQPGVVFNVEEVIANCHPILCFRTEPIQIILNAISTSDKEEVVIFSLDDFEGVGIENPRVYIQPGEQTFELSLDNQPNISSGDYYATLMFTSQDESLVLENRQGGADLRFDFLIDSIWNRCRRNAIVGGLILFILLIISRFLIRRVKESTRKPSVVGTLIYWKKADPDNKFNVDLNEMGLSEVKVGSDPGCDIFINDPSVTNQHFKLLAMKEDSKLIIKLLPLAELTRGYRKMSGLVDIEEDFVYSFGDYEFRFIPDPNVI